jgi:hypothetical protein
MSHDIDLAMEMCKGIVSRIPDPAALTLKELQECVEYFRFESVCIEERNKKSFLELIHPMLEKYRHVAAAAGMKHGLPDAVFKSFGMGGMRQFIPYAFLDFPMAVFERSSQATSAQMELKLPSGETFTRDVYTIRHNKKMALTGRQENVLFTLFNDEFMQLTRGPRGVSILAGSVERLRELTGGRVRMDALIDDLRALGDMRVAIRDMTKKDGVGYAIRGSLFTLDMTPDPGAWRSIGDAPAGKHPFVMVINDMVAFNILQGLYQRIDMGKFWAIPKPRDRHVYAYLLRHHSSVPVFVPTFCRANGFSYAGTKQNKFKTRRAIGRSLETVAAVTGDFMRYPGAGDWFIDTKKIGWCMESKAMPGKPGVRRVAGFAASIPSDITQAYFRHAEKMGVDGSRLVRQVGNKLKAAYKLGGIPAYDAEVARYRAACRDW